eukprot:2771893-Rhodomonas_salina.2
MAATSTECLVSAYGDRAPTRNAPAQMHVSFTQSTHCCVTEHRLPCRRTHAVMSRGTNCHPTGTVHKLSSHIAITAISHSTNCHALPSLWHSTHRVAIPQYTHCPVTRIAPSHYAHRLIPLHDLLFHSACSNLTHALRPHWTRQSRARTPVQNLFLRLFPVTWQKLTLRQYCQSHPTIGRMMPSPSGQRMFWKRSFDRRQDREWEARDSSPSSNP